MATKIRLKRLGKIRSPHYRIIVIDERAKRSNFARIVSAATERHGSEANESCRVGAAAP